MAASDQGHKGGGLHSLGSLINDDDIKGARHARKQARPRERQRAAHDVGLLKDGQLYAVTRRRTGRLPTLHPSYISGFTSIPNPKGRIRTAKE